MREWNSVKDDGLPDEGKFVLIYDKEKDMWVPAAVQVEKKDGEVSIEWHGDSFLLSHCSSDVYFGREVQKYYIDWYDEVTHWMPMPKRPPKRPVES